MSDQQQESKTRVSKGQARGVEDKTAYRCRNDEAREEVHGKVEAVGRHCCHEQVGGEGHAHDSIVGEVQQGLRHEQEEPEELACRQQGGGGCCDGEGVALRGVACRRHCHKPI